MRRLRAFSLVELLVVITIIAVLASLLMPMFDTAYRTVNMTRCQTNLRAISQALKVRSSDERMGTATSFSPTGWPTLALAYMEGDKDILLCPEGGVETSITYVPPDISELAELRVVAGSNTYFVPLAEDVYVVKLSQTQYNDAKSKNYLGDADAGNYLREKFNCAYTPDDHPDVFWLCIEDHGGDWDFKDVMVKVTDNGEGSLSLDVCAGGTGHTNTLMKKPENTVLFAVPSQSKGLLCTLTGQGAATSYAINVGVLNLEQRGRRIFLMDYAGYLAKTTDDWTTKRFDVNRDGKTDFARHLDMVNVLFSDGSAAQMYPAELDPSVPTNEAMHWSQ